MLQWIFFAIFLGSPATGPTSVETITLYFADKAACEAAAPAIDQMTRRYRVLGSSLSWTCLLGSTDNKTQ